MAPKPTKKKQRAKHERPSPVRRAAARQRKASAFSARRKRAERAVDASEQQLHHFIEQSTTAVAMFDYEMRYLAASQRWLSDYGITADVIGQSHYEVFPEIPEKWKAVHRRGLAGEVIRGEEDPFLRADGSTQWVKWEVRPWFGGREVGGITIVSEEVTAQVQSRIALQESEARLRQVLEETGTAVWDWDVESGKVYWTLQHFVMLGYRPNSVEPSYANWAARVHPEDLAATETAIRESMEQRCEYRRQFRTCWPDGTIRWIEAQGSYHYRSDGSCQRMVGVMKDITARKQAEDALRMSEERFRKVFEYAAEGIVIADERGNLLQCNTAFCVITGYSAQELAQRHFSSLIHPDDRAQYLELVQQLLERKRSWFHVENRYLTKSGRPVWVQKHISILFSDQGIPLYLVALVTDITQRKRNEWLLQSNEAFTREVLDSLSAHVCVLDRDGIIIRTNEPWKRFAQANSDKSRTIGAVGDNYLDVCRRAIAEGDATVLPILSGIEAVLAGKQEAFSAEYPCHSSDEQRWFLFRVSPLVESQGVVLSHQDISDRKRAEETLLVKQRELERSQTELEELNAKLLMTQETERQRIARELHDDITQRIATVAIDLQGICSVTPGSEASLLAHIHQTGKMAEQITTDLQRLAYQLHPTLLEHSGLEAAVQEHVEEFEARTGLKTKVQIRNLPTALSLDRATCLYRVLQESLQNVRKHANATYVVVRILGSTRGVGFCIHDDGHGFDQAKRVSNGRKGLGLVSMKERVGALQGTFRIKTKPGDGIEIHAWVPLEDVRRDARVMESDDNR
ncbi:MAG: PAS domain S-box protein [Nitrospira sp.]|nr:PAS domain S-box protein [Nitrospira sp.]